jgi:hypothetical protein
MAWGDGRVRESFNTRKSIESTVKVYDRKTFGCIVTLMNCNHTHSASASVQHLIILLTALQARTLCYLFQVLFYRISGSLSKQIPGILLRTITQVRHNAKELQCKLPIWVWQSKYSLTSLSQITWNCFMGPGLGLKDWKWEQHAQKPTTHQN